MWVAALRRDVLEAPSKKGPNEQDAKTFSFSKDRSNI